MNLPVLVLTLAIGIALSYSAVSIAGASFQDFKPLYFFESPAIDFQTAFLSSFNSIFFAFVASALFFGFLSPVAMLLEGLKFGRLFATAFSPFDVISLIPIVLAAYAGLELSHSLSDSRISLKRQFLLLASAFIISILLSVSRLYLKF